MNNLRILFKFATRSRPDLFKKGMQSIQDNCVSDNYHILVTVDDDDPKADSYKSCMYDYENTVVIGGYSDNKIHAINRDMGLASDWDILINMSDDMVFTQKGFDDVIRNSFDNLDQCLHFPDGNRNDLITMAIMGRKYYERFNYIYHPAYQSLFCDNEMTEVAKILGCYKYVGAHVLDHRHPAYQKAHMDEQYIKTEAFYQDDQNIFMNRRANNFNL